MTNSSVACNQFRYWYPVLLLLHNQTIDLHQAEKRAPGKVPLMEWWDGMFILGYLEGKIFSFDIFRKLMTNI